MRIAVYTLTWNRLGYTRHCFATLRAKAGYEFDHYVLDNGSDDGTVEWLRGELYGGRISGIRPMVANIGNARGNNAALELISGSGERYDLIVRMDNDCEVVSHGILASIADFYGSLGLFSKRYVVSPRVEGINRQPSRGGSAEVGKWKVGLTALVGGLFRVAPADIVRRYRWPEGQSKVFGEEASFCSWVKAEGGNVGYIEDLVVNHYETTDGQALRYPDYHSRKMSES